ncbi:MAG: glycosyl hydrolase [Gammaproteobacteria bacterium]
MKIRNLGSLTASLMALTICLGAHGAIELDSSTFGGLSARSIGPAVMSGRIAAVDGVVSEHGAVTLYVGTASGGVWKSDDGGIVYAPVFDKHQQSIGAVRIDPSEPETIWVGTGESSVRNTVSPGDGVYVSRDGGDKWTHVGLKDSDHIPELLVHPADSNVVYVCALGHLWAAGGERGVFRTKDGGETWQNVLRIDDATSCSDLAMTPDGDTLYAGMWQVRRYPDFFESGGEASGLYRSTDGGDTWQELTDGLPSSDKGRISVAVAASEPTRVYAVIESDSTALYRSDDGGDTWEERDDSGNVQMRPFYFGELVVDPTDANRVYKPSFTLSVSDDGGETFSGMFGGGFSVAIHPDHHALWINPNNPRHVVLGTDGGVYISSDRAFHWRHVANMPVSQFYHVAVDSRWPYNVYGGLQDNGSWMGPSQAVGGIQNKDWQNIGFGDGFWSFPDPSNDRYLFVEYQGGQLKRVDRETLEVKRIQPAPEDGQDTLRFNWNTPLHMSAKKPGTIYYGAQYLYRSQDRGESWEAISPDLTTNDPQGQRQEQSGGLTIDNSTAENYTTIYSISESPLDGKTIWVGTDDGNVQVTRNGGRTWVNVIDNVDGVPEGTWVSRIEASPHDKATAFVTFDGHRRGDMATYVYLTTDYGKSWTSIASDDINGYAWVIKQDPVNPALLFLGTEEGLFISLDSGENWARFKENLPQVAVHDLVVHPTEHDLVVGTHGRGVYIIDDITPLRGITQETIDAKVAILPTRPAPMVLTSQLQSFGANDAFYAANPPQAATIVYHLKKRHLFGDLKVEVFDDNDRLIATLPGGKRRGLNRVEWPMRFKAPKFPASTSLVPGFLGPRVPEGEYRAVLTKGKETLETTVQLVADPRTPHSKRDRTAQQALALELYDMVNNLSFLSDNLIDVRDQARARAKAIPEGSDAALGSDLKTYADALEGLRTSLSVTQGGMITGQEKLRERLGTLYGNVTSYDGKPSSTQFDRRDTLGGELADALGKGESMLAEQLDAINSRLSDAGLDTLASLDRDEWNQDAGVASFTTATVNRAAWRTWLPQALWGLEL